MRLKPAKLGELLARQGVQCQPEPSGAASPDARPARAGALLAALDPVSHKILLLLTRRDVSDWGEEAEKHPREVARELLEPGEAAEGHLGRELARRAGFPGADHARLERLVKAAHALLVDQEFLWVELRFAREREGFSVVSAEAEVNDEALVRHPELGGELEAPVERPLTEREKLARQAGLQYCELEGDIGLLPGGPAFGMALVDLVKQVGGHPANLMDSGGEVGPHRMKAMLDLLLDDPRVLAVLGVRYAGLTRADQWARLAVDYILEKNPSKPLVLRLAGNGEEDARRLFEEAAHKAPEPFKKVWVFFSNTNVDNAAREAVALAELLRKGEDPFAEGGA